MLNDTVQRNRVRRLVIAVVASTLFRISRVRDAWLWPWIGSLGRTMMERRSDLRGNDRPMDHVRDAGGHQGIRADFLS